MNALWWIVGSVLAAVWLDRARDARAMRDVPDLDTQEWDKSGTGDPPPPSLTVIVPARNEEKHIQQTLQSLLAQDYASRAGALLGGSLEIIAVDDRSTDRTGEIMDALAQVSSSDNGPRLRVLHIDELPPGWLGKTHAMWSAAQQASGDWLLFTDADVVFRSDLLRRALTFAERSGADHAVLFPYIPVETFSGKMMLAFFQMLFVFGHRPWKVADPRSRDSIGFGGFNLIRRSAYEHLGTWQTLRLAIVEDMKLGELVKLRGLRSRCAFGTSLFAVHWARTGREVVRNLTKNFFAVMKYRPSLALAACLAMLFFNLAPFAGVIFAPAWSRLPFAFALAALAALYAGISGRTQISPLYFFAHPLATVMFVYVMLRSMTHAIWHGGVVWRGTKYSLDELRREAG